MGLVNKLKVMSEYNQKENPFKINCVACQTVAEQEVKYTFSVNAYQDPASVNCLVHFQLQSISDAIEWRRWFRNMMEELLSYDIFVSPLPAFVVDQQKENEKEKKSSTENSVEDEEKTSEDKASA